MCLGDVLGFCLAPLVTCTKYICSAIGIALVFSAGVVGLDLASDWPILLIILACILALIWFMVAYCGGGLIEREDEGDYLCKQFELICETQVIIREYEVRHNYASDLAESCVHISNTVLSVFYQQMLHALLILAIFLILTIWFVPVGAKGGFFIGVLFGYGAITLVTWATFSFAARSVSKVIISAIQTKDELFSFMYTCGFGVIMLAIAALYFIFLIAFFVFKNLGDLKTDTPQEKLQIMGIHCCGYGMGVVVSALIYRESTSILGRSIFNSIDGLIKADKNLSFNNPYISQPTKILYVIQNILSTQIVNLLDCAICIAVLTIAGFVMFSDSEEIAKEDITWKSLLAPTLYFCVNCFCAVVVQLFKTIVWNDEVTGFTKINVRLQVLITHTVTLFIFYFMPIVTILGEFTLSGVEAPEALKKESITIRKITYSCILGQLCNLLLLSLIEWITSHGCGPIQNMAKSGSERIQTQSWNYGDYLAACGQILIVVTLGVMAAAVFNLAGYAGIMAAAAGFLINIMIMVPIFYIGTMSSDGYKLCCAAHVTQVVTDRLLKMTWAARNYMVYLKITTAGSAALLALTFMGCALYLIKGESNPLFDFNGAFGMIFGVGLAFLLKGMTVGAVISVSKAFNLNIFESGIAAEIAKNNRQTLDNYLAEKFLTSVIWIYIIFITDTIFMLVFGYFFGKRGSPGFLLGHSVIILFMMMYSVVKGAALKNSRYYNEVDDKISKKGKIYNSYVQGDMYGTIMEESTAIPLIVYLLYNVILVTCLHPLFGADGDLFQTAAKKE